MESGLLRLVYTLLTRLYTALGKPSFDVFLEYVANTPQAWDFPLIHGEQPSDRDREQRNWAQYLASLDTAILSLAGDQAVDIDEVSATLDEALGSSLWTRRLRHQPEGTQRLLDRALKARATLIWTATNARQRRGYFLSGVGLTSGQQLDAIAQEANALLVEANGAILAEDDQRAIEAITALAERLFAIPPFIPDPLPVNWRLVLSRWLEGAPIVGLDEDDMTEVLRFVENGLIYKLPWGMEAVRVRAQANYDDIGGTTIDSYEVRLAVPAIETGTLNQSATMLMQAGFTSRLAAIKAVMDTEAGFSSSYELVEWLRSELVTRLTEEGNWPTQASAPLWKTFLQEYSPPRKKVWSTRSVARAVRWRYGVAPPPHTPLKVRNIYGVTALLSATHEIQGHLDRPIAQHWSGHLIAVVGAEPNAVALTYHGPSDIDLN